jgi:hypothetical protein
MQTIIRSISTGLWMKKNLVFEKVFSDLYLLQEYKDFNKEYSLFFIPTTWDILGTSMGHLWM